MRRKIDTYFKHGLDVPQEPPTGAWDYIQQQLDQKEKKRYIPLWGKISGFAGLLMLVVGGGFLAKQQNWFSSEKQASANENQSGWVQQNQNISSQTNSTNSLSETSSNHQEDNFTINKQFNSNSSNSNSYETNSIFVYNQTLDNSYHSLKNSEFNESNSVFQIQNPNEIFSPINIFENQKYNPNHSWKELNTNLLLASIGGNVETKPIDKKYADGIEINSKKQNKSIQKSKKDLDLNRFYISGFVSPMMLNTFVGGSMLGKEMKEFKTINNITSAYGVKGAYALNDKLKIRTGVSMIGFEQITKNVPLTTNLSESGNSIALFADSNITYTGDVRISSPLDSSAGIELGKNSVGNIQQQSNYLEIPIEAELNLLQTQSIGISATAGGSTWLLSKNKIYVSTEDFTQDLGRANNLNKTSFSANAGLKFDLKLSDDIHLNVEPHFKYLLNQVNNIEKYNPYTVGVNAGISINLK